MNITEKQAMLNPEHKPLMDLPLAVQKLMRNNLKSLLRLRGSGQWVSCENYHTLYEGYIYMIDPNLSVDYNFRIFPVFCGKDGIYKAEITCRTFPSIRYLTTLVGMKGFAGIRYENSADWQSVLDIVRFGVPKEVRFRA